ncbi:MarR family transcriptional regulator [Kitasatospora sp. RG8]|uniref:MarR family transcriptional regulator n=1 Tax=Kitasatospora sp. RG8 TaxID=2820815 RepID=UPI001ADEE578|nr:helix-turn-helix domain-containing protein [Kitasatospora sp. RG8]MBP0455568.1 MarR family transcriptional regulator [Kitasatospora sp. RG8]
MNGVELLLLGRTLARIGEDAIPVGAGDGRKGGVRSVVIVMSDVYEHPDSAVGEIAARTGLPQSQVSTAVARLREAGSVVTEADPRDRRRLLVRRAPEVSARRVEVASATVDDALARALGTDDPQVLAEVQAALEVLGRRLTPATVRRLRAEAAGEAASR